MVLQQWAQGRCLLMMWLCGRQMACGIRETQVESTARVSEEHKIDSEVKMGPLAGVTKVSSGYAMQFLKDKTARTSTLFRFSIVRRLQRCACGDPSSATFEIHLTPV